MAINLDQGTKIISEEGNAVPNLNGNETNMATARLKTPPPTTNYESKAQDSVRKDFIVKARNGLLLGFFLPGSSRLGQIETAAPSPMNSWLQIGSDGTVTLTVGTPETLAVSLARLARVVADELAADPNTIKVEQVGPRLISPPASAALHEPGRNLRPDVWKVRSAGAIAREMLVLAAMNKNGDGTAENYCARKGMITHLPSRKTYAYGQVAADAAFLPLPGCGAPPLDAKMPKIAPTSFGGDARAVLEVHGRCGVDAYSRSIDVALSQHRAVLCGTLVPPTSRGENIPRR